MADLDSGDGGGHGKKRGGLRAKKMSTKIDMTPMVDLAFLLVTFFMMTTTFNKPNAMEVIMPEKKDVIDSSKVPRSEAMTVVVAQKNRVFYYTYPKDETQSPEVVQTNYSASGLRKVLLDMDTKVKAEQRAGGKEPVGPVVLIKAIDEAEYGHVVDVLDEMKIAAIGRYAIVDITPEEKEMIPAM